LFICASFPSSLQPRLTDEAQEARAVASSSRVPLFRRMDFDAFIARYDNDMTDLFKLPSLGRRSLSWYGHSAADLV